MQEEEKEERRKEMRFYLAGLALIIFSAILAIALGVFARDLLGPWIFAPLFIGFILQGIGFFVERPNGPNWPHQF